MHQMPGCACPPVGGICASNRLARSTQLGSVTCASPAKGDFCRKTSSAEEISSMKCLAHPDRDAQAICSNCGRALCQACVQRTSCDKIVCSASCGGHVIALTEAILLLRARTLRSFRMLSCLLFLFAGLAALVGIYHVVWKFRDLGVVCLACSVGAVLGGVWCLGLSRPMNGVDNRKGQTEGLETRSERNG
jgi:hypothetical protein